MEDASRDPDSTVEAATVDRGYALAERVRAASFRVARRGYDRDEVDGFLAWLADELRSAEVGAGAGDADPDAVRRELERIGESTAAILRAAEQTARELRGAAKRDAEHQVESARAEAERTRADAEEFAAEAREEAGEAARRLRLEAGQRAEEAVREAETRAESILENTVARRRVLDAQIDELTERRDAILVEVARLADELRAVGETDAIAAERRRPDEAALEEEEGTEEEEAAEEEDVEEEDVEEEDVEAPAGRSTLLVDPDEDGEPELQPGISDQVTQEFATHQEAEGEADGDRR